jgi:hypothetical protein
MLSNGKLLVVSCARNGAIGTAEFSTIFTFPFPDLGRDVGFLSDFVVGGHVESGIVEIFDIGLFVALRSPKDRSDSIKGSKY